MRILILLSMLICVDVLAQDYVRYDWHPRWYDFDKDCQDSRIEVLNNANLLGQSNACDIKEGLWYTPYLGKYVSDSSKIDIDHIVPLEDAHTSGGALWPKEKKRLFANDMMNLVVSHYSSNRSKQSKQPHEWMPPRREYHCEYLFRYVMVKEKWGLTIHPQTETLYQSYKNECGF